MDNAEITNNMTKIHESFDQFKINILQRYLKNTLYTLRPIITILVCIQFSQMNHKNNKRYIYIYDSFKYYVFEQFSYRFFD